MNFSEALEALQEGKKIRRAGWNGTKLFLVLQKGYPDGINCNANTAEALGVPEGTLVKVNPYIALYDGDDNTLTSWATWSVCLLKNDWQVLDNGIWID